MKLRLLLCILLLLLLVPSCASRPLTGGEQLLIAWEVTKSEKK